MATAPARPPARGRRPIVREEPPHAGGARRRGSTALAWLGLGALLGCAAVIVVGAAGGPSPRVTPSSAAGFPAWFAGPLAALAPGRLSETAFWFVLLAMGASYLAVLALVDRLGARSLGVAIVALHLLFALAPPLLSTDAFGYMAVGRAVASSPASAYAPLREVLASDPVLPLLVWQTRPNPYGPLFTAASLPLAPLGLAEGLWVVKALAAAASLGLVALVGRTARGLGRDPATAVAFVGLNPILLVWGVGGAHNDALLMMIVVGCIALSLARRERLGGAAAAVAVAVKASVALLVPILVLATRRRGRTLAGLALGLLASGAAALAVLGPGIAGFPVALAAQAALRSPNSVIHALGTVLGVSDTAPGLRVPAAAVLVASLALSYVRTARGADPIAAAGWATVATLVTTTWLMPWYVVWVLPLAALAPGRGLRVAALGLCAFVAVMRAPLHVG